MKTWWSPCALLVVGACARAAAPAQEPAPAPAVIPAAPVVTPPADSSAPREEPRRSRVAECNRLIDAVNQAQPSLSVRGVGDTAESLVRFATLLEGLAATVRQVDVIDPRIVDFRGRYARLAEGIAGAARKTAAAFDDAKQAAAAAAELNSFRAREQFLVREINDYCGGKASPPAGDDEPEDE